MPGRENPVTDNSDSEAEPVPASGPKPAMMTFKVHGKTYNQFTTNIYLTRAVLLPNHKLRVVLSCWEPATVQPAVVRGPRLVDQTFTIQMSAEEKKKIWGVEFFVMGSDLITEISSEKGLIYYQKKFQTSLSQLTMLGKKIYSANNEPEGSILLTDKDNAAYTGHLINRWVLNLSNEHYFMFPYQEEESLFPSLSKTLQKEKLNFTEDNVGKVSDEMLAYFSATFPLFRTLDSGLKAGELTKEMVDRIKNELSIDFITPEVEQMVIREMDARKSSIEALPTKEPELESKDTPALEKSVEEQPEQQPIPLSSSPASFWNQNNKSLLAAAATVAAVVVAQQFF